MFAIDLCTGITSEMALASGGVASIVYMGCAYVVSLERNDGKGTARKQRRAARGQRR
jgi:hypothetical protein